MIALWHDLGSIVTPTLLLPVGTALLQRGRLGARWTLVAMLTPFCPLALLDPAQGLPPGGHGRRGYPWSIEPIYVGLAASLLVYSAGWLRPKTEVAR